MKRGSRTVNGVIWCTIERIAKLATGFVAQIFVARQLMPSDYGTIAMLSIFMAVANTFIDSGFSNALIQKQDRTQTDYSTVFYFNVAVAILLYGLMLLISPLIADFYDMPILKQLIPWYCLTLIISSFYTIQRTILTIRMDFKRQAIISVTSGLISCAVSIYLAYNGYGVWTLVIAGLIEAVLTTGLLWISAHWHPSLVFSKKSFNILFNFGSKLLCGNLINIIYQNLYTLVIGKAFSATDLGNYNKGYTLSQYPTSQVTSIVSRVSFPRWCALQDDKEELTNDYFLFLRFSSFIIFPICLLIVALAHPLIGFLLTSKWLGAVFFLQTMCIAYMFAPIKKYNVDVLNAISRSDLTLKAEVLKKIAGVAILLVTVPLGVKVMALGVILYSLIDIAIILRCTELSGLKINFVNIANSLLPILVTAIISAAAAFGISRLFLSDLLQLISGISLGLISYLLLNYVFNRDIICKSLQIILTIRRK